MVNLNFYSVCTLLFTALVLNMDNAVAQKRKAEPALKTVRSKADSSQTDNAIELVNTGYIGMNKNYITGSSATLVNDNHIKDLVALTPNNMVQGQISGLRSISTSAVGAITSIRGIASFNAGSSPLYIVDGIPVKTSRFSSPLAQNVDIDPLSDIHPEDIESITVLKDAQATGIYGMRGANGVILITTIGGTTGRTDLNITAYTGFMEDPSQISVLDSAQYRSFILAKERASGVSDANISNGIGKYLLMSTPANQYQRYNNNTNWQDVVSRNGMTDNFHLSLRGGDAVAKYSLNVGYSKLKAAIINNDFSRFNVRFNLDYKVGPKLSFINSLNYSKTTRDLSDQGNTPNTNQLFLATLKSPVLAPYQKDIKGYNLVYVDSADYNGQNNPISIGTIMINQNNTNRISGKTVGQYTFSPHLVLRVGVSFDYFRLSETRFIPSAGFAPNGYAIRSSSAQNSFELMYLNENTLTYTKSSKSGKNQLSALIGSAIQSTTLDSRYGRAVNNTSDQQTTINTSNPLQLDSIGSVSPAWKLVSFFGSANYAINNKYIFAGNIRADGSSRFQKQNRWGYFPSVSFAWRLNKENFLKNNKSISDLKLRASYGISGNENVGVLNAYNALIPSAYIYSAVAIGVLGNPNFQWESTKQFNAGFDITMAKGRLAASVDFYNKNTDHLYNIINLPSVSGFSDYAVSSGSINNKGIDAALSWKVIENRRKLSWQMRFNIAYNKNMTTSLPSRLDTAVSFGDYTMAQQSGVAIGSFFGYHATGVYARTTDVNVKNGESNTNPFKGGDVIFEDVNHDGIIDFHDRKVLGNVNPDVYGGFTNSFSYKHFELSLFTDFAFGGKIYNARRAALQTLSGYTNESTDVLKYWKNEGDITDIPRLLNGDPVGNSRFSSRFIESGSYVRIKSLTIAYNLPLKSSLKGVFSSARMLLTGQNLVTFSKYKGYSPEVGNFGNPLMYGVDYGNLPPLTSIVFGIQLGL